MSDETVGPAMSGEDWASLGFSRDTRGKYDLDQARDVGGVIRISGVSGAETDVLAEDRHALAALCLHEQPYGFSWDDLATLGGLALNIFNDGELIPGCPVAMPVTRDALQSLASRIAALLPPRP